MKKIAFVKMHGLGNDFLIIHIDDNFDFTNIGIFVQKMADHKIGVGCDQLIFYKTISPTRYEMIVYNQDGSVAKICGNVSRCLTKLIAEKYHQQNITLLTNGRELKCSIQDDLIKVNMGPANFAASWMPSRDKLWEFANRYSIDSKDMLCVDMCNPHLILFSILDDQDQALIGEILQNSELFPDGVNVNFATIKGDDIELKVWERGAGFTLACGSGACATYAAARKNGYINDLAKVIFTLGSLSMSMENDDIIMAGPAIITATGEYYYD